MEPITDGIHTQTRRLRYLGLEVGTRMTILTLQDGLLIHSPLDVEPSTVKHLGEPRWVLAPNKLHHLFIGPWMEAGIQGWAAPGLPQKRKDLNFAGVIEAGKHPFGPEIETYTLTCFNTTNEVLVLHKPSRSLIVTDLVFNFTKAAPLLTRAVMWTMGGYPGCKTSLIERLGMDKKKARHDIDQILAWDFDRLIPCHGDVIHAGAKEKLKAAYAWLKP